MPGYPFSRTLRCFLAVLLCLVSSSAWALPECPGRPDCPDDLEPFVPALEAVYVSRSVPASMVVGQPYNVSVTMRNTGTATWTNAENYRLGSLSPNDNTRWGMGRVNLPHDVPQGGSVTFNFQVVAPLQAGQQGFQWGMVRDGVAWFGLFMPLMQVQVKASSITGAIDSVTATSINGWACSTGVEAPVDVHVYAGGAAGSGTFAASARADRAGDAGIASACGTQGNAHRFQVPITTAMVTAHANKTVYVHGISPVGAANSVIAQSGVYRLPVNQVPTVTLTSPANGSVVSEGKTISLKATATDGDDGVASVTFNGDGAAVATTSPPTHSYAWPAAPGNHTVQAIVRDTRGATASSAVHSVHVSRVIGAITEVRDGRILGWTCNTQVAAAIKVRLYAGGPAGTGTSIGDFTANVASASGVVAACGQGTAHDFVATPTAAMLQAHAGKVLHAAGLSALSGPNNTLTGSGAFTLRANQAPVVRITSPTAGAVMLNPASTLLSATASDPDGTVQQVQLLVNGVLKTTLASPPYQLQVADLGVGTHRLKAIATDARGATGSDEITIKVEQGRSSVRVTRQYVYDDKQQLCKVIEPETGTTVMDYDAAGNLAWSAAGLNLPSTARCDRDVALASGRQIVRTYDARNRLSELGIPQDDGRQQWKYAADGLPTSVTTWNDGGASTVTNTYAYNAHRDLTKETSAINGASTLTVSYTYDGNGHVATEARPGSVTLTYARNALGQPTSIADATGQVYAQNISWHPGGGLASLQYGNGMTHQTVLNARLLPAQLRDSSAVALDYQYDAGGNVMAILDQQQGTSKDVRMQYDGQGRLLQATSASFGGDGKFRYQYDVHDNLVSTHLGGVRANNYWYDARNQLTNVRDDAGATMMGLAWDAQGNLATRNGQSYRFDLGNRLREVVGVESYRYDAQGRRVTAVDGSGQRTRSFYGASGQLLYETRRGQTAANHIYLGNRLLATRKGTTVTWRHVDALGSPVATTNASGAVVERQQYEPYGAAQGGATDGVGYTGHVMDAVTGLTYMQQRYYDPQIGLLLSVDPVTAFSIPITQFHRYRYANNNPYKFVDPDGNKGKVAWLIELGANQMRKLARLTQEQAVQARRAEQNVLADRRQVASQIEAAAHGRDGQLKHAGHELKDGGKGLPHYQTDGVKGHSFWGKLSVGILAAAAGLDQVAEAADVFDPSVSLTSGSGELVNHERTWFGAYKQIDPNGPSFYEADRMRAEGFQGVFRVEGRIDSKHLGEELKGK